MENFVNKQLERPIFLWLITIFSSLSVFIIPLVKFNQQFIARDWTLYNCFSYFNQSIWLHYKTIPIHNPYVLGGMDLFASPQTKTFSPLAIFDFFLSAPYASLFSVITLSVIGSYGMFKLLTYLKVSKMVSLLCMVIYAHSSWFALHFTEGHVTFGSFQLMSLVLYFTLQLEHKKYKVYLAVLLSFMILDGGMYAFIYSVILIGFSYLFRINGISIKALFMSVGLQLKHSVLALTIFVGLSAAKLIPFLSLHYGREPILETIRLDVTTIFQVLFNPFQHIYFEIPGLYENYNIGFHEIGAYIGILSALLIVVFLIKKYQHKFLPYLLFIILFFWIGTGIGEEFNPWIIFQKIPIINNAHVQTRALFIMYFMALILLSFSLDYFLHKVSKYWGFFLVFILVAESLFVSNYSFFQIYQQENSISSSRVFKTRLHNTTVSKTIASPGNGWGKDFQLFEQKNVASRGFLDNAVVQGEIKVEGDENYKGEVYFIAGEGSARVLSYTPNGLEIEIKSNNNSEIQFNTNYLLGWVTPNDNIEVYEDKGLLTIKTSPINEVIFLKYQPSYLYVIIPLYFFSLLLLIAFLIVNRKRQEE